MQIAEGTATKQRTIGAKDGPSFTVQVPTPYAAGYVCDEAHASILNQTLAENVSNNLRSKLIDGRPEVKEGDTVTEAARPWTPEEAQALVDEYIGKYTPGVRQGGDGAPRITDPVEREALSIAGERVDNFLEGKGLKRKDVDFKKMRQALFDANREKLMKEAKRVVDARNKAIGDSEDLTDDLINFLPGVGGEGQGGDNTEAGSGEGAATA